MRRLDAHVRNELLSDARPREMLECAVHEFARTREVAPPFVRLP
jgi:hypothetical protein